MPTSWLPPGNFTVASCCSLYLSKAGASEEMTSSPSAVRALTSIDHRRPGQLTTPQCLESSRRSKCGAMVWYGRAGGGRLAGGQAGVRVRNGKNRGNHLPATTSDNYITLECQLLIPNKAREARRGRFAYLAWRGTLDEGGRNVQRGSHTVRTKSSDEVRVKQSKCQKGRQQSMRWITELGEKLAMERCLVVAAPMSTVAPSLILIRTATRGGELTASV